MSSELDLYEQRLGEQRAKIRLTGQRLDDFYERFSADEECAKKLEELGTLKEQVGALKADYCWLTALSDNGVAVGEILEIWDTKDQSSRDLKIERTQE